MKGIIIYCSCVAGALLVFLIFPQIDLGVSGLFYDPVDGFFLREWGPGAIVYRTVPWVTGAIIVTVVAAGVWLFLMQRPLWRFDRRALLFIVFAIALGPGLLANTVLKDHWGRARPSQIVAFGGTREFTPAPLPASQCRRNCSFVSGHAALGFSVVAFGFLLPAGRRRRCAITAALGYGGLVGLVRIAQGGHFLSDVVWAGLLVFGLTAVLNWWIVENDGFTAPTLIGLYQAVTGGAARTWHLLIRAWAMRATRMGATLLATAILVVVSIEFIDRPVALYLHRLGPDEHNLFNLVSRLGEGWGWLVLFGLAFFWLHWGGELPRLRRYAPGMRVFSAAPAFLFASITASGLVTDVLKVGFGRMRPKLLFSSDQYGFGWLVWRPDYWSFPSGHTATIVALMTALWCLWPRHLLFYILVGAIVAAARVIAGAHYPSDVVAAAMISILVTRCMFLLFARAGIDLTRLDGSQTGRDALPWPCRRFQEFRNRRRTSA